MNKTIIHIVLTINFNVMKKFLTLCTALLLFGSMTVKADTWTATGEPASVFGETWNPELASNDMTLLSNNVYAFTKGVNSSSETDILFKVCKDHGWGTAYPSSNYAFTIPSGQHTLMITYNSNSNAVMAYSSMTVAGDNGTLFGGTWNPENTANDMTLQNDGTYKFEKSGVALSAGTVKFKACANHAWDNAWPSSDYELSIPESGNYTITITFNPATLSVSASADLEEAVVVIPTIKLHGNFTGSWADTEEFAVAANNDTASLTLTGITKGTYNFGVKIDGSWVSNGSAFTRANYSHAIASGSGDCTFNADRNGNYTFKWAFADNTLKIIYPAIPAQSVTFNSLASEILKGSVINLANCVTSSGIDEPTYRFYIKEKNGSYGDAINANYSFNANGEYVVKVEALEYGEPVADDESEVVVYQSYTFTNGSTIYVDFSAMTEGSKGVNYPKVDQVGMDWDAAGAGTIKKVTFTDNVTWTTMAESFIKTEKNGWAAQPFTVPGTGKNCVVVAEDGASYTWDIYSPFVAGSATEIFGTPAWDPTIAANKMTWDGELGKFKKVYTVDKAYKSVSLKVVYDNQWYGVEGGEDNVKFSLSGAGEFTVLYDKTTHYVTLAGEIVDEEQFDFEYAAVAANGEGNWAHGENWNAATTTNRMTEVAPNIWEISFDNVPAKECQLKFCFDGTWDHEFGGEFSAFGTESPAVYGNASGSINFTSVAGSIITILLDLSNFNFATKEGATFTVSQAEPIAEIGGKFIINAKGDTAVFSRGNLQYKQSSDTWRCAPNQYDWRGMENLQMGNAAYAGWVDLFSWSIGAENNYGATSAYNTSLYFNKEFVDWSGLFDGNWSTLSIDQWFYMLYNRANANDLWGMAMIGDTLGMVLLPNDWNAPSGVTFVPGTTPTTDMWEDADCLDPTMADQDHWRINKANMPANKFTEEQWAILEAAGAVFCPYGGRRSGGYGNHTNRDNVEVSYEYNYTYYENYQGAYWTSTVRNAAEGKVYWLPMMCNGCINENENWGRGAHGWWENGRYGHSVRLVHIIPRQYSVTYTAGEGEGTVPTDDATYLDGAEITLAAATGLSKEGYRFAGWKFKGQVYNGTYTVNNVLANEEIVFEAQWEKDWQEVRGGLTAGNYYTVCYDKTMTEIRGASLWSFASKAANIAYIVEAEAPYAAGTPYLIYAESEKLEAILVEVASPAAGNENGLYGTLSYMDADALSAAGATHMLKSNEIRPLGNNNHLAANRAYIILNEIPGGEPAPAPGRRVRAIPMQPNTATGIDAINATEAPAKLIINGQLYILRGEKMYDATGRLVK